MEISLSPFWAKNILRLNPFNRLKVMCLGYDEDFDHFTELVWKDDKNLDFYNKNCYPKFQLWHI